MHELFAQVLEKKDLSKAGDLFSLDDKDIEDDLSSVLQKLMEISNAPDYLGNDNNQSVVEICITRVTSAIRETNSIEKHANALVSLLESCLQFNLAPSARDEDPPHAKIASDILSCMFLNYSKQSVMDLALPVAVKFLGQGNKELGRNMSSYLSLAAIDNCKLLAQHLQPITDSVKNGNLPLSRVLPQIYAENRQPINDNIANLVSIVPKCETAEKSSLLQLFGLVAKHKPRLLEQHIPELCEFLGSPTTSNMVLQTFVDMAVANPEPFLNHMAKLKQTADQQTGTIILIAKVVGSVGKIDKGQAKESVSYLVSQLASADNHTLPVLLKEVKAVCELYPSLLLEHMEEISKYSRSNSVAARMVIQQLKDLSSRSTCGVPERKHAASQTEGIVTVITVNSPLHAQAKAEHIAVLSPATANNLPNSKNASTSTREISFPSKAVPPYNNSAISSNSSVTIGNSSSGSSKLLATATITTSSSHLSSLPAACSPPHTVPEKANTIATSRGRLDDDYLPPVVNKRSSSTYIAQPPINAVPFNNAVQQFCEKHLDKIKAYISNVNAQLPIPIKATLEEHRHRKSCKLHFICAGCGDYCLYSKSFFTIKTRQARVWIHLMFLAIQARSQKAVSVQDPSVGNLKACWDALKAGSANNFVRLVTSSFPSAKDQDGLFMELNSVRYFDIFELNAAKKQWACFLCNYPEKAYGLLQEDGLPVIEGQLKEKKGRWKFFKRWKTRHFTLAGGTITYSKKDSGKATLPISTIQTVKAVRKGVRDIPKAFEIFTNDQTYVLKAKDGKNAEQWLQCLHIAVARSQCGDGNSSCLSDMDVRGWELDKQIRQPQTSETQTKL